MLVEITGVLCREQGHAAGGSGSTRCSYLAEAIQAEGTARAKLW